MTCGHCKREIECRGGIEYVWQFEATATRYSGEFAARADVFRPAAGVACSRACLQMLLVESAEAWHPPTETP